MGSMNANPVVSLPAALVGRSGEWAQHCVRHGRPAKTYASFVLQSQVPHSGPRLLNANVLTMAERTVEHADNVRVAQVRGGRCARHVSESAIAILLFGGGVLAFGGSLIAGLVGDAPKWLAAVAAGGFLAVIASAFALHRGGYPRSAAHLEALPCRVAIPATPVTDRCAV